MLVCCDLRRGQVGVGRTPTARRQLERRLGREEHRPQTGRRRRRRMQLVTERRRHDTRARHRARRLVRVLPRMHIPHTHLTDKLPHTAPTV